MGNAQGSILRATGGTIVTIGNKMLAVKTVQWGGFGLACGVGMGIAFGDPVSGAGAGMLAGLIIGLVTQTSGEKEKP